jgi:hypothetical protein
MVVYSVANKRKDGTERTADIHITMPIWMIDEVDRRGGEYGRSKTITELCRRGLSMDKNEEAVDSRIKEIEEEIERQAAELKHLQSIKDTMVKDALALDDPRVVDVAESVATAAYNYQVSEREPIKDKAIKTMAEKWLNGPMPQGFIEKVRGLVDERVKV